MSDTIADIWTDRRVRIGYETAEELAHKFNPDNWRGHPDAQAEALDDSLDLLGWVGSVKVNIQTNRIFDGHLRVTRALVKDPSFQIPVDYYDLTEDEEALALQVHDAITEQAEPIADKLAALMERTRAMTADRPGLAGMLKALKARAGINGKPPTNDAGPQIDKAAQLAEVWGTALGQVWELGRHIIACIDSTDEAAVKALIDGRRVGMVWADPPYGMGLDTDFDDMFTNDPGHRVTGHRFAKVIGDDRPFDPMPLMKLFDGVKEQIWWGADYYADKIPVLVDGTFLVWDKRCSDEMDKVVGNVYEMAWLKGKHRKQIARILWSGHHGMQGDDTRTRVHPTQKPVALPVWCFTKYGQPNDLIFDPFLGSGISVLAAENLNDGRRVIGCELAHQYIAVILERWHKMTNQHPRLLTGPTPHPAASAERVGEAA